MPIWAWVLIVLGVAFVGFVIYANVSEGKKKRYTLENGEATHGWLVQANNALFEDGFLDSYALIILSPDKATNNDRDYMTELADRIMELKTEEGETKAERKVSRLMADETYVEGKWDKLPDEFTGGKPVYLAHLMVYRDDLPGKKLKYRKVYCSIVWDEPGRMVCTRPFPKDEEEDEDDED
jgi:hypothetical protein